MTWKRIINPCFLFFIIFTMTGSVSCSPKSNDWQQQINTIKWVAYSPSTGNPMQGIEPEPEAIKDDLAVLSKAGFNGLVTYAANGVLGRDLPALAKDTGYKGLIIGIWDLKSENEITIAKEISKEPIVLGFCIGNEGLDKRYNLSELSQAIQNLRDFSKKPVTTTEEIDDYTDEEVMKIGDWVFPNAHPYFHSQIDPESAVEWTRLAYNDFKRRTKKFVLFKEVGLPTAGDEREIISELSQDQYYTELAKTPVRFVYFEAFDMTWKTHLPIEPHWGIFNSDRTPKRLGLRLMGKELSTQPETSLPDKKNDVFWIYQDADSINNHFDPTGYMGDCGDIQIDRAYGQNPFSGNTCIRIVYEAKGKGPYSGISYPPPARWAGVYWQYPPNNWGTEEIHKDKGYNLSAYHCLVFWARADAPCKIEFKVGGINEKYGDSLKYPRSIHASLTDQWQKFEIDLKDADLKHIIGGFCWVTNQDTNPNGAVFYLDDIFFK